MGLCVRACVRACVRVFYIYNGQYTSQSNANFDLWLKNRDPRSAIRDFEALNQLAQKSGLSLVADYAMPANNRILHWVKQ